jgi:hypothetical protein
MLGIATILHWDKFNHSHISFYTWTVLYFTTPFLILGAWLRNRSADPGAPDANDVVISLPVRLMMGGVGGFTLLISLILFLAPQLLIDIWPWTLTPLTARVVGAMFSISGIVGLGIALDSRWSAARIILQTQVFTIAMMLIASVRAWGDFNQANPVTWIFTGGLAALLVGVTGLYFVIDRQKTAAPPG